MGQERHASALEGRALLLMRWLRGPGAADPVRRVRIHRLDDEDGPDGGRLAPVSQMTPSSAALPTQRLSEQVPAPPADPDRPIGSIGSIAAIVAELGGWDVEVLPDASTGDDDQEDT